MANISNINQWYKFLLFLQWSHFSTEKKMAAIGDTFKPGDVVPVSGIYKCTTCNTPNSTDVKGHRFPPSHCTGALWKLSKITNP
ncbi:hypothetical protein EZV77_27315 [Burkholderia thailandensis]|nr:hypothetical protein CWD92_23935 [Burkholderia thailandensis]TBW56335.1 hypothetical protein EZV77_27315 [Burkholderia thailandensis]